VRCATGRVPVTSTDIAETDIDKAMTPARSTATYVVLGVEAALVLAAVVVGAVLNHRGVPIHADAAPLYATWLPHVGPGTPLALGIAVAVVYRGPDWAGRLPWRRLLLASYLGAFAWTLALALVDGWSRGLATRLTPQAEYLHDVPRVTTVPALLSGFTGHIVDYQPGSWATHVAGHPPGAFLVFVLLDRVGLGGGGPAALLCVLVGASAPVSVAVALRALAAAASPGTGPPEESTPPVGEAAARAALPFLVLFPGAVWVGASADGLFTGVVAAGLALLAVGGWRAAFAAGLLLGTALYLSYGLVLVGLLTLAVLALRRPPRLRVAVAAGVGAACVIAAFTLSGFWWLTGYHLVVQRYYQGWAAQRPYGYWIWADLAALVLSTGPVVGPALVRAARSPARWLPFGALPSAVLPFAALLAIGLADLSGLSKAEVERIWLPYEIWLLPATACLPVRRRRGWLAVQALTALAVNHLLLTGW
jgi:methylthioxylose transferase